jgi:hypothetical protein
VCCVAWPLLSTGATQQVAVTCAAGHIQPCQCQHEKCPFRILGDRLSDWLDFIVMLCMSLSHAGARQQAVCTSVLLNTLTLAMTCTHQHQAALPFFGVSSFVFHRLLSFIGFVLLFLIIYYLLFIYYLFIYLLLLFIYYFFAVTLCLCVLYVLWVPCCL